MSGYDASFDISKRRLIDGPRNNLMAIYPLKHAWARDVYKVMIANTWTPNVVDLARDIKQYKELTDAERKMYDRALAFLSNLDGIQFNNLAFNIGEHITSPEVAMCISRQSWEEVNHVESYSVLIEAVSDDPLDIYTLFSRDETLARKNEYIMAQSAILKNDYSKRNFALAVVANIILEGIYFYSGFLAFYTLARMGKMTGSADMIRLIQRDEEVHLELFSRMLETLQVEYPEIFDAAFWKDATELIDIGVRMETDWGCHIIEDGVLGLTNQIIHDRIRFLADKRLARIGRPALYGVKDPVAWVENFSLVNGIETNFFEGKSAGYQAGGLKW